MKVKFKVINYNSYKPTLYIDGSPIKYTMGIHPYKEEGNQNFDFSFTSFSVTHSLNSGSVISLRLPAISEKSLENIPLGAEIQLDLFVHTIFRGIITSSSYNGQDITVTGKGLMYLLQKIYNPAMAFNTTNLKDITTSIINTAFELQNIDFGNCKYLDDEEENIILDGSKYTNIDSYSALQQILSSARKIMFETILHGEPYIIVGTFSQMTEFFESNGLYIDETSFFYDTVKTYNIDGIANSIFVLDKNADEALMIYPKKVPEYVPKNTNTKIWSDSEIQSSIKNRMLSSIAVYDVLPNGFDLETIGKDLIKASYLNFTGRTMKFPGLQILAFPGYAIKTTFGTGLITEVNYNFSNFELWQTVKIQPRGGW